MILSPTFEFKGTVLPIIDKTDKFYLLIENNNNHRILLNIVFDNINKFVNVDSKSTKVIFCGNYKTDSCLKIFYFGNELFEFNCSNVDKEIFKLYSEYVIKNVISLDEISFTPVFINGLKLITKSNKPQNLFIKIVDNNQNEIIHEDNFISGEPYIFKQNRFVEYGIFVYNSDGQKIYNYNLNLKNKKVFIKLNGRFIIDFISWFPYVDEFRKKHQCEVFCSTNWNNLFIKEYPDIKFLENNEFVDYRSFYAVYKIGFDNSDKLTNTNLDPQKIASEILGVECKNLKFNNIFEHMRKISTTNTI